MAKQLTAHVMGWWWWPRCRSGREGREVTTCPGDVQRTFGKDWDCNEAGSHGDEPIDETVGREVVQR